MGLTAFALPPGSIANNADDLIGITKGSKLIGAEKFRTIAKKWGVSEGSLKRVFDGEDLVKVAQELGDRPAVWKTMFDGSVRITKQATRVNELKLIQAMKNVADDLITGAINLATGGTKLEQVIKAEGYIKGLDWMKINKVQAAKDFTKLDDVLKAQLLQGLKNDNLSQGFIRALISANDEALRVAEVPLFSRILDGLKSPKTILWGLAGLISTIGLDYSLVFGAEWFAKEGLFEMHFIPLQDKVREYRKNPSSRLKKEIEKSLEKLDESVPKATNLIKAVSWLWPFTKDEWNYYADGMEFEVQAVKDELAGLGEVGETGTLRIEAQPADAKIQVEGQYAATGIFSQELEAGTYAVSVSAFGYKAESFNADVIAGETTSHSISLTAESGTTTEETGGAEIKSTPEGAKIYVDNIYVFEESNTTISIPVGNHKITLKKSGWNDKSMDVIIYKGITNTFNFMMSRGTGTIGGGEDETGLLQITSTPTNAKIYVDNEYVFEETNTTLSLPIGTKTITLKKSGYEDKSQVVNILKERTTTLNLVLTASEGEVVIEETKANVTIRSNPINAKIYVDDNYMFEETNTTILVNPGLRKITLKKGDYKDYEYTRNFTDGEIITLPIFTLIEETGETGTGETGETGETYVEIEQEIALQPLTPNFWRYKISAIDADSGDPINAQILMDDAITGNFTPWSFDIPENKLVNIKLRRSGYPQAEREFRTGVLTAGMTLAQRTRELQIEMTKSGYNAWKYSFRTINAITGEALNAKVFIDGVDTGNWTPWSFYLQELSSYLFRFERYGFESAEAQINTAALPTT